MRFVKDYMLTDRNDLAIAGGDFVVGESTQAHQQRLVSSNKGDYKEDPTRGVGASTFLDDEGGDNLAREIAQEFMRDGMEVTNIKPDLAALRDDTVKLFPDAYYI